MFLKQISTTFLQRPLSPPLAAAPPLPGRRQVMEPQNSGLFMFGILLVIGTFVAILAMFASRPVTSEEDEIVGYVTEQMKRAGAEWVAPEAMGKNIPILVGESLLALMLYRLRLFVLVDPRQGDAARRVGMFVASLERATYDNRSFPIDLEVRLLTDVSAGQTGSGRLQLVRVMRALSKVAWWHGRFSVSPLPVSGRAEVLSPASLWLPMSDWELAAFVDLSHGEHAPRVATAWFSWLERALAHYGVDPRVGYHALGEGGRGCAGECGPERHNEGGTRYAALHHMDNEGGWEGSFATHEKEEALTDSAWYEFLRSFIGRNRISPSLLGFSLDIPYPRDAAPKGGTAPGLRANLARDFAEWVAKEKIQKPAYLAQRPGMLMNVFFPGPWRQLSASWAPPPAGEAGVGMEGHSPLPLHTKAFQRWIERNDLWLIYPLLSDGSFLLTDRASFPLSKEDWTARTVTFPPLSKLHAFDSNLRRSRRAAI